MLPWPSRHVFHWPSWSREIGCLMGRCLNIFIILSWTWVAELIVCTRRHNFEKPDLIRISLKLFPYHCQQLLSQIRWILHLFYIFTKFNVFFSNKLATKWVLALNFNSRFFQRGSYLFQYYNSNYFFFLFQQLIQQILLRSCFFAFIFIRKGFPCCCESTKWLLWTIFCFFIPSN